ncbi:hypothetical protein MBLNU230_g3658t1 [Neophaeotheca triangularis]
MHSFLPTALCLALVGFSDARVANPFRRNEQRDAVAEPETDSGVESWFHSILKRTGLESPIEARQDGACFADEIYNWLSNDAYGEEFCRGFFGYPNVTSIVDVTSTITTSNLATTNVITQTDVVRTTPTITVTVTGSNGVAQRLMPRVTDMARRDIEEDVFERVKRQENVTELLSATGEALQTGLSSAFSSACGCQTFQGSTVTETYTQDPVIVTVPGFARTTSTVFNTLPARAVTVFVTIGVNATATSSDVPTLPTTGTGVIPTEEPAITTTLTSELTVTPIPGTPIEETTTVTPIDGTPVEEVTTVSPTEDAPVDVTLTATATAPVEPQPTAPGFACPEDHNTTVSQLIGNERFDYKIFCDTDILDANSYTGLSYDTFSECVAACSLANGEFNQVVCAGIAYYEQAGSCFLKSSANNTVSAPGVNAALLARIAVGISDGEPLGTTTSSAFGDITVTMDLPEQSSSMSSILENSTTTIPIITPGPQIPTGGLIVDPATSWDWVTFVSEGQTVTSWTSWATYWTESGMWYTSFWSSYELVWSSATTVIGEGGGAIATGGVGGGAGGGSSWNRTETIVSESTNWYSNGSSTTIQIITENTYNSGNTLIGSTATTVTYYAGATGGAGGGSGGGAIGGDGGIITGTGGTPIATFVPSSTQFVTTISGNSTGGGAGGEGGGAGSGVIPTPTGPIFVTTEINTFTSIGGSGGIISGIITPSASNATLPLPTETDETVPPFTNTEGPRTGTEDDETMTMTESVPIFTNTEGPRTGTEDEETMTMTISPPSNTTLVIPTGTGVTSGNTTIIVPTGTGVIPPSNTTITVPIGTGVTTDPPFTNTEGPRTGTEDDETMTMTMSIPINTTIVFPTGTGVIPPSNTTITPPSNITTVFPTGTGVTIDPPFTNTEGPRTGTEDEETMTMTISPPSNTTTIFPTQPPLVTGPTTCPNATTVLVTTTIFATMSPEGCPETCIPRPSYGGGHGPGYGYGPGGPHWGPPSWW